VRTEAFGQWPLQVNTFKDIHESLENSTAHEYFDQSCTSAAAAAITSTSVSSIINSPNDSSVPSSGQERWFTQLPPVLVLELSRFHYNTERKAAEKIHNRLEFEEKIFMDRYMHTNRIITRRKRDEVRRLKERRANLNARLDRFTNYRGIPSSAEQNEQGSTSEQEKDSIHLPLPTILKYALDFANTACPGRDMVPRAGAAARGCDVSMNSPSTNETLTGAGSGGQQPTQLQAGPVHQLQQQHASAMQVDSPCGSPKVTPASSVSNLNAAPAGMCIYFRHKPSWIDIGNLAKDFARNLFPLSEYFI